jgi:hypothetical protein
MQNSSVSGRKPFRMRAKSLVGTLAVTALLASALPAALPANASAARKSAFQCMMMLSIANMYYDAGDYNKGIAFGGLYQLNCFDDWS